MSSNKNFWLLFALTLFSLSAFGKSIETNNLIIADAPDWLTESRLERITNNVDKLLEWDIRKTNVIWYTDQAAFEAFHQMGPAVQAITKTSGKPNPTDKNVPDSVIYVGPKVTNANFDGVFGHELCHVILRQKYKSAIPVWLEEGLANFGAKGLVVDYGWLVTQPIPDVTTLGHPFRSNINFRYHYQASTALAEMLDRKCGMHDLLQLSVGAKLETYLQTNCEITDINATYKAWIQEQAKKAGPKAKASAKPKAS